MNWQTELMDFFQYPLTPKSYSPHRFRNSRIYTRNLHIATLRDTTVLFLGWDLKHSGSYVQGAFMSHALLDYSEVEPDQMRWIMNSAGVYEQIPIDEPRLDFFLNQFQFVPVLSLDPDHHDLNLLYLNEQLDHFIFRLVGKRKPDFITMQSKNYRVAEQILPNYVKFHGIERSYVPETFEERIERLGLTRKLTGFISRRIVV